MSGTGQEDTNRWTYGVRVIANQIDRATWRNTLTYRFHPRFTAGIEYNPLAGKASPLANLVALKETHKRPALILGTSSDRIATPFGQSFYATFSKTLKHQTGLPVAPYVSRLFLSEGIGWVKVAGISLTTAEVALLAWQQK